MSRPFGIRVPGQRKRITARDEIGDQFQGGDLRLYPFDEEAFQFIRPEFMKKLHGRGMQMPEGWGYQDSRDTFRNRRLQSVVHEIHQGADGKALRTMLSVKGRQFFEEVCKITEHIRNMDISTSSAWEDPNAPGTISRGAQAAVPPVVGMPLPM